MATRITRSSRARATRRAIPPIVETYADSFPRSTKVYLDVPRGVRVPMR